MTSILLVTVRFYSNQFKWLLSKENKFFFWECFAPFLKSTSNFEQFEKNMTLIADVFPKSRTLKDGGR